MSARVMLLVLVAGAAQAAGPLSLSKALGLARDHSNLLAARQEELGAADLRVKQSWARLLPRVSTTARYSRVNLVDPPELVVPVKLPNQPAPTIKLGEGIEEMASFGVLVEQPLFTGGALWAQRRATDAAREAARERVRVEEQELAWRTEELFVGVLRARQLAAVAAKSEGVLAEHLARVERLERAGTATSLELSRAKARLAAAHVQRLQTEAGRAAAELGLATLLGLEPAALGDLEESTPAAEPVPETSAARPDVKAALAGAAVKDAQVLAASAPLLPQVALRFGAQYDNPNQRFFPWRREFNLTWDASIVASWTVWDWGGNWLGREAAAAEARAARLQASALAEAAQLELSRRRLERATSAERIAASEAAVGAATSALGRAQRLCDAGQAACLAVLDAEAEVARLEAELVTARLDARLADAALRRAAGTLSLPLSEATR